MITEISWEQIEVIWRQHLWTNRISLIEPLSAMCYLGNHDIHNMNKIPTFFGCWHDEKLIGVNSGHLCTDNSYRSRGLWVSETHRGCGIGSLLLQRTIDQGMKEDCRFVWSYPRKQSWKTYKSVGFVLTSDWLPSETSQENAYCQLLM